MVTDKSKNKSSGDTKAYVEEKSLIIVHQTRNATLLNLNLSNIVNTAQIAKQSQRSTLDNLSKVVHIPMQQVKASLSRIVQVD